MHRDIGSVRADLEFQAAILPGVSRTFALTIPVLPGALADTVANAYLLCRLADTIEDDSDLDNAEKSAFHARLEAVVRGDADARALASDLEPRLSSTTLAAERTLVANLHRVVKVTQSLSARDQETILRCLHEMCCGMPVFLRHRSLDGLADIDAMSAYCYVVAGVVGEMLTDLFCAHSSAVELHRRDLMRLAPSFGQGLQMTNILKDVWDDRRTRTCWLPRCVFGAGFDLARLEDSYRTREYRDGIEHLIGITHRHLRNALDYALLLPNSEPGLRRFCLWAIGFAVLTLRKVRRHCDSERGVRIRISRRTVGLAARTIDLICERDGLLRGAFGLAGLGLPLVPEAAFPAFGAKLLRRQFDVGSS
jgi:farnesyl-diphosphate farnesyltransferase